MSRWFRWQFMAPRLLLVMVALLAAQYALGLAAMKFAARQISATIGAPVGLARARVSLIDRQITFSDLHAANPCRPAENLLQADRCELDFDVAPLLHKQLLVERGRITGLRFGGLRGANASSASSLFHDKSNEIAGAWLAALDNRFELDLVDQFESVQRSKALSASWQQQATGFNERTQDLKRRTADLQERSEASQVNRLRNDKFFNSLPKQIATLRKEYAQLCDDMENLAQSLDSERRAIIAAEKHDEQLLRERLRLEPVDATMLTDYLLRESVSGPVNEVIGWLRAVRQVMPANCSKSQNQIRGENISFAGVRRAPNFLIRAVDLQGSARIGTQPVDFRGTLTDVTTTPSVHGHPMQLRLTTAGSVPFNLLATIDRTGPVARDELLLDCRGLVLPELCLGQPDQLQMKLTSSIATLSVSASLEGEELTGEVQLVQKQVGVTPVLGGDLSDVSLAAPLQATLGQMNSIATRLSLHGTIDEPSCTLWSNLGPAVAEAMERALRRTGDEHARAMLAEARRNVDERLATLERQIADQKADFASQMAGVPNLLDNIASQQSRRERISVEQLGRRLPSNSLFR